MPAGSYALFTIPISYEIWYLEPKMVHLAWRVQAGVGLYPDWTAYPQLYWWEGPDGSSRLLPLHPARPAQHSLSELSQRPSPLRCPHTRAMST